MSLISSLIGSAAIVSFGMLEGYAFVASGLAYPEGMKAQMRFINFGVMKMFLSAVGGSMIAQSAMDLMGIKAFDETRHYCRRTLTPSIVAGGCTILGVGMYLSGSGPTLMPSQLAVKISTAPAILAGAFTGGLIYSLLDNYLPKHTTPPKQPLDGFKNYSKLAIPVGTALVAASFGIEKIFPAAKELQNALHSGISNAILPSVAGLILGLNQIPLRIISGRGQGGSTPVLNVIATMSGGYLQPQHQVKDLKQCQQFLYVYVGTFLGGLLAAKQLNITYNPTKSSHTEAFVGGVLMLFGARLAEGCTCGHGVTGFSEFNIVSIIGTACIFGGGMISAALRTIIPI